MSYIYTSTVTNGILNSGLSFSQVAVLLMIAIIGTIAIRFTFNLDLNKLFHDRAQKNLSQLKNACPHVELIPHGNDQMESRSLFISPPGTIQWQCQRCGVIKYFQDGEIEAMQEYYVNHIDEYNEAMKKFQKLLKRGKHIK